MKKVKNLEVESKLNPFRTKISELFNLKYSVEEKPFNVAMLRYFKIKESKCGDNITKVSVFKKEEHIDMIIETHRPHVLIGTGGEFVGGLREHIRNELNVKVRINVQKSTLWNGIK